MSATLVILSPSETTSSERTHALAANYNLPCERNVRPLTSPLVNNDQAGFTGHIKDSATGLNYMQARYYDPLIGRFLSTDPIGFSPKRPEMFGRYTYVGNDPVNAIDPSGEKAWLVSRPSVAGQNHMFVAVQDDKTGDVTRFTYGPQRNIPAFRGKLVSLTGTGNTDDTDRKALASFIANSEKAAENGIVAELINASDADVIASGQAVDATLGTKENPAKGAPKYDPVPIGSQANSNSAAYAVADRANPNETQAVPNKGKNSGQRQHRNIPRTGTRIKDRK